MEKTTLLKAHDFEPTDTEGHAMQCTKCGRIISFYNCEDWDNGLEEECEK